MLTAEMNERLTRVGPGTPMGELLRRYWFPIATDQELAENPVKPVRLLGESLTLFRDLSGRLGVVAQRCAHRGVDLRHGIPQAEGLRCIYHGWMYDTSGQCVEQPAEAPEHGFKERVKLTSYPAEALGGLIWTYLGPEPVPLLPRWDIFAYQDVFRVVGTTGIPCNWLQCQENSVDTVHTEYVHGRFGVYVLERLGITDPASVARFQRFVDHHHAKIDFKPVKHGIQKLRLTEGQTEESAGWTIGHPLVFPNYVLIGQAGHREFQIRVPVDDTHTWHLTYTVFFPGPGIEVPPHETIPTFEVPIRDYPDWVLGQDIRAWPSQGEIADRTVEKLAETDRGLIMFRKMLQDQMKIVEDGGDPINVFRDPEENRFIELEMEDYGPLMHYTPGYLKHQNPGPLNTVADELDDFLGRTAEAWRASGATAPAH